MVQIMSDCDNSSRNRAERASLDGKPEYPDATKTPYIKDTPSAATQIPAANNTTAVPREDDEEIEYVGYNISKSRHLDEDTNNNVSNPEKAEDWGVGDPWAATSSFVSPPYNDDNDNEAASNKTVIAGSSKACRQLNDSAATASSSNSAHIQTRRSSAEEETEMETKPVIRNTTPYCYRCFVKFPNYNAWKKHAVLEHILTRNPYPIVEMNYIDPRSLGIANSTDEEETDEDEADEQVTASNDVPQTTTAIRGNVDTSADATEYPQSCLKLRIGKEKGAYVVKRNSASSIEDFPPPRLEEVAPSSSTRTQEGVTLSSVTSTPVVMPMLKSCEAPNETSDGDGDSHCGQMIPMEEKLEQLDFPPEKESNSAGELEGNKTQDESAVEADDMISPAPVVMTAVPADAKDASPNEKPDDENKDEEDTQISRVAVTEKVIRNEEETEEGEIADDSDKEDEPPRLVSPANVEASISQQSSSDDEKKEEDKADNNEVGDTETPGDESQSTLVIVEETTKNDDQEKDKEEDDASKEENEGNAEIESMEETERKEDKEDKSEEKEELAGENEKEKVPIEVEKVTEEKEKESTTTGDDDFQCQVCHKNFTSDDELNDHFSQEHFRFAGNSGILEPESPFPATPQREEQPQPIPASVPVIPASAIVAAPPTVRVPSPSVQVTRARPVPTTALSRVQLGESVVGSVRRSSMGGENIISPPPGTAQETLQNIMWRNQVVLTSTSPNGTTTTAAEPTTVNSGGRMPGFPVTHPNNSTTPPGVTRLGLIQGQRGSPPGLIQGNSASRGPSPGIPAVASANNNQGRPLFSVNRPVIGRQLQGPITRTGTPPEVLQNPMSLRNALTGMTVRPQPYQRPTISTSPQNRPASSSPQQIVRAAAGGPPVLSRTPPAQNAPLGQTIGMNQLMINQQMAQRELNIKFLQRNQHLHPSPPLGGVPPPPRLQQAPQSQPQPRLVPRPGPASSKRPAETQTHPDLRSNKEPRLMEGASSPMSRRLTPPSIAQSTGTVGNTGMNSIRLGNAVTLSVCPSNPMSSNRTSSAIGSRPQSPSSVLAMRGVTVTPASPSVQSQAPVQASVIQRGPRSVEMNRTGAYDNLRQPHHSQPSQLSPPVPIITSIRGSVQSDIHRSPANSPINHNSHNFAVPRAPPARPPPAYSMNSTAERPDRPPTVDLTDDSIQLARHQQQLRERANGISIIPAPVRNISVQHQQNQQNFVHAVCNICELRFPSARTMQEHQCIHHGLSRASQSPNFINSSPRLHNQLTGTRSQAQPQPQAQAPNRPAALSSQTPPSTQQGRYLYIPLIDLGRIDVGKLRKLEEIGVSSVIPLNGAQNGFAGMGIPVMGLRAEGAALSQHLPWDQVLPMGPIQHLQNPNPRTVPGNGNSTPSNGNNHYQQQQGGRQY